MSPNKKDRTNFDVVVVGAGFAGCYMLHRLRGMGLSVRVFEIGKGVGGTWYWNRYPGARCDIESMEYSYQFSEELQQEWEWTERYASQPEILAYLDHVADRFDLRRDIQFETRVTKARFDEAASRWTLEIESETHAAAKVTAQFYIMATGCLSSTNMPDIPGLDDFEGDWYHTGRWPHAGVDFSGKRVGVIGTGSSGIQSIPLIAEEAQHLIVFQRTPNYSVPAHNAPIDGDLQARVKADYPGFRARNSVMPFGAFADVEGREESALGVTEAELEKHYDYWWQRGGLIFLASYGDLMFEDKSNATARAYARQKIRDAVDDPDVAALLTPDQVFGCKRLCADSGYFETFNRRNVELVDIKKAPIEEITQNGLRTADAAYELDVIVFATGYDAMTGALFGVDIRGRKGQTLVEKWRAGPRTYLGLGTAGFPNLFTITGPGSPSVLANMVPAIEQHVNWIADCIDHLRSNGLREIEVTHDAEDAWVEHVNEVANMTLFPGCNSWYLGANIEGKPRVFMPYIGFPTYVAKCEEVVAKNYEGFVLS
jgi:cyclohexanone monooxygenase